MYNNNKIKCTNCCRPSHLLALLAEHDVAQVHQVGQQVVAVLALPDQVVAAGAAGGSRTTRHHFVPAGRAAAHRRNYAVERSRHRIYDIRGGQSAGLLQARVLVEVAVF